MNVCPATYAVLATGVSMLAIGALPAMTSSLAELLVVEPYSLLTTQRNVASSSASVVESQ